MVAAGDTLPPWRVEAVSAEKMKTVAALLSDPNPIHFDVEAVRALGMGERPINQGPLNMGYVMNMLASFSGGHQNLRRFRVRFLGNVLAGDELEAGGVVTAVRQGPEGLLAECDVYLRRADGVDLLRGNATVNIGADEGIPGE